MKNTSQTIVFFGNERLATGITSSAPTLRALIDANYTVAAVVVNNSDNSHSRKARTLEIATVAAEHGIPLLSPDKPAQIIKELESYGAAVGVLVSYGKIIPQAVLDIFPCGIINIHPSRLPLYRGSTPIESALLDGISETAVSIMQLTRHMDRGPVLAQQPYSLGTTGISKQAIADDMLIIGADLLVDILPKILDGSIESTFQDESKATYSNIIEKSDGVIDWHKDAVRIAREVVAYAYWPRSSTILAGKEVIITEANATDTTAAPGSTVATNKTLEIGCGRGSLIVHKLIPSGKKEMPIQAFLAGNKL